MSFLKRHPWVLLAALTIAGAAASLTMLMIAQKNAPEHITPEPTPPGQPVIPKAD